MVAALKCAVPVTLPFPPAALSLILASAIRLPGLSSDNMVPSTAADARPGISMLTSFNTMRLIFPLSSPRSVAGFFGHCLIISFGIISPAKNITSGFPMLISTAACIRPGFFSSNVFISRSAHPVTADHGVFTSSPLTCMLSESILTSATADDILNPPSPVSPRAATPFPGLGRRKSGHNVVLQLLIFMAISGAARYRESMPMLSRDAVIWFGSNPFCFTAKRLSYAISVFLTSMAAIW